MALGLTIITPVRRGSFLASCTARSVCSFGSFATLCAARRHLLD